MEDEMVGLCPDSMDMSLRKLQGLVKDRAAWHAAVPGVAKSQTWLSDFHFHLISLRPQFSSVTQSCLTVCNPMDFSTPGFSVHQQLLELAQTHVHWVSDAIQPSHPLLVPSPPVFILSHLQGLFQWVGSSHQLAKVLELQLQHQSFQWVFRTDFL